MIGGGGVDARDAPPVKFSLIFMQFSANILHNNRFLS